MSIWLRILGLLLFGFIVAMWALKRYISGGRCYSKARLDGKTVIVTGASSGIGKETAKDMARRGARVILACRNEAKVAEEAKAETRRATSSGHLVIRQLDLSSLASIRAFAEKIKAEESRLDVLINNAGVMMCPKQSTEDGFEMQFGVNHLGHFLLTNLLLDLIKSSAPSRIVNVSSSVHYVAGKICWEDLNMDSNYGRFRAYAQSKLATMLFTLELSRQLQGSGVTVNALHPGVVRTELFRHVEAEKPEGVAGVIAWLLTIAPNFLFKSTVEGAQTSIYCAVAEKLETVSGLYFSDCAPRKPTDAALNAEDAKRLWELSAKMVGLEKKVN